MRKGVATCGVLSKRELSELSGVPSAERLAKGSVAVVECNQEIPCNPCQAACPRKAIRVDELTSVPVLDEEKCNGCGTCVAPCPGLAIFVVDMTYSDGEALVTMPYEFLPYPDVGETVDVLDRSGKRICEGTIEKVRTPKKNDRTAVVLVSVLKKHGMEARAIRRRPS
jgi:Fe-S-cluster-containing hydrogenase component 2